MQIRRPTTAFITPMEDSRRWESIALRDGDILVSTPPKCGTTWTQGIVHSLLWPDGDAPGDFSRLSPWIDVRFEPIETVAAAVEAQPHRRFLKTHSPADATPFADTVRYLAVYRSAPDALVSWGNHRAKMRPVVVEGLNAAASADGVAPMPTSWDGDYDTLFEEWSKYCSPVRHLASWWPLRDEPNVLLLHYADLLADLEGEMRRIAGFLGLDIAEELWDQVVERCRLDSMREAARGSRFLQAAFDGGADSFFHKGENDRGRQLLTEAQLDRVALHVQEGLPPDAAAWLEAGGRS
jgi:aryl sulfotransferase